VCLGDVIGYGARPLECLALVRALVEGRADVAPGLVPGLCLLGNHEQALLEDAADFNPNARRAILWTRDELSRDSRTARDWFDWIGALRPSAVDERAQFVHGSPRDPVREYVVPSLTRQPERMHALFRHMERGICFVGHSHIPAVYFEDDRIYLPRGTDGPYAIGDTETCKVLVNVGSVGQPRDRDPRLSYLLFDGERITFVRLEYDVRGAQDDIRAVDELPPLLAERLARGD
jgi:diadenosine tetraphosphatase ApaH/serine/threonine PP2A family protein phosphatase